jgi:hypothetical protein
MYQQPIVAERVRTVTEPEPQRRLPPPPVVESPREVFAEAPVVRKRERPAQQQQQAADRAPLPGAVRASELTEQERATIPHWKDVHGLKIEEVLTLDKLVRSQRFKPVPATMERVEFTIKTMREERDFSTRGIATFLYKGGCKSIWFSTRGHFFFGLESMYLDASGAKTVDEALSRLPDDDEPSVAFLAERAVKR